jgi:acyl carrier protein
MNETQARALAADVLAGIAPEADLATVRPDEDLRAALDLDSMDFMNFVIGLSERSGHAIPETDVPRLYTLRGLVAYFAAY